MKIAVVKVPGLNRDGDMIYALKNIFHTQPILLWETDSSIPPVDLIVIPGGFSYGDYLRCGAIAARTPVMQEVIKKAHKGTPILGVCNGFQILIEAGLLPGALLPNQSLKFICRRVALEVLQNNTRFTKKYKKNQKIQLPIAHHDGNFFISPDLFKELEDEERIVFRYTESSNPNGSMGNIAGIINKNGNVLGMMPHPENFIEQAHGGDDGRALFESIAL